ncbi:MAG: hypothetical protein LBP35_03420 [Candidatus Ancillula trichonymphae]|nr:hypothetical protein [Candidatus Ancillula trichonymphae]
MKKIAAAENWAAALTRSGKVYTWGQNTCGELGCVTQYQAKVVPEL